MGFAAGRRRIQRAAEWIARLYGAMVRHIESERGGEAAMDNAAW